MLAQVVRTLNIAVLLMWCGQFLGAQTLTVNKYQFKGSQAIPNLQDIGSLTSQQISATTLGAPVLYAVTIENSGSKGPVTLTDILTPPFTLLGATCTSFPAGDCTGASLTPPTLGPFTIDKGDLIVLLITVKFNTVGLKNNEVMRVPRAQDCFALKTFDCYIASLNIPGPTLGVDLEVKKTEDVTTATFGSPVNYSITFTNKGPDDVHVGGIVKLEDRLTNFSPAISVKYTLSNFVCTPSPPSMASPDNVDCPDLPVTLTNTLQPFNSTAAFDLTFSNNGHIPPGRFFTITFKAVFDNPPNCGIGPASMRNEVFLQYSTNSQTISDGDNTNNRDGGGVVGVDTSKLPVDVTLDTKGLDACPPDPNITISKKQLTTTPTGGFTWGALITYQITVTNPSSAPVTDVLVSDDLLKTASTPPFLATLAPGPIPAAPICSSACAFSPTALGNSPLTVDKSFQGFNLFKVKIASIPAADSSGPGSVTITFTVSYASPCQTNTDPGQITNQATTFNQAGSQVFSQVFTPMAKLGPCALKVTKMNQGTRQVVFGQPVTFTIMYQNLSAQTVTVGSVEDVLSQTSQSYGDLPVTYSVSCTGAGVNPAVPPVTNLPAVVKFNNPVWAGITLINQKLTFDPNATLTCTVSVTATRSPDPDFFCQGIGTPQLINSAFMELSADFPQFAASSGMPAIYDSKTADLPLCRKVQVNKSAQNSGGGPGRTVIYTITVTNQGTDPVSGFMLTDPIDPKFALLANPPPTCTPAAACTPLNATVSPVTATFAPIPGTKAGGNTVTITFAVKAPLVDDSYLNAVVGSFAPPAPGDPVFYFGGDPVKNLNPVANIQVLTPPTGFLEICKASSTTNPVTGIFTFTSPAFPGGSIMLPVGTCTGPIPVTPGTVTITEAPATGVGVSAITASGLNPATQATDNRLVTSDLPNRTATVTVAAGDVSTATIATFTNFKVPTGFVEVCKAAAPGATVTGSFTFNIPGAPNNPYTIPVGACSGPIPVQAGSTTITEAPRGGYQLVDVTTLPADRLVSKNLPGGSAIATVVGGDLSTETVVIFFNDSAPGQMKICKIAGTGIVPGQTFTISSNGTPYMVPAGPASQGGFCVLDSTFPVGTVVNVQETIPSGDQVSSITVNPPDRGTGKPDLVRGAAQVTIGTGFTEVTYTNTVVTPQPSGQLTICKIAGQGVDTGTNFTFTATGQGSTQTYTVPAGPASQGGFCVRDGTYPIGAAVTIKEVAPARTGATSITVTPADRGGKPDLTNGSVVVTIGTGLTEVAFTNSASVGIATTALLAGQPGVAFSQTLAATGGTPPYFWQVMDGALPPGFVLNPFTGEITGPPMDDPAPVLVTFKVMDSSWPSQTESASFTEKSSACCSTMRPSWARRP